MISIQQNLTELEKFHRLQSMVLECYVSAINNMAQYAVDLNATITPPHRQYLTNLAAEVADASPEGLAESGATLRGLLRQYRDQAAQYLGGLRDQLSASAQALQEIVEALSQCDTDQTAKLRNALVRLREVGKSPEGSAIQAVVEAVADSIEQSLEQIRKQHQFTVLQFKTELRLLHSRIDTLEAAASIDEATKFPNQRFMSEYLSALPPDGASYLILKLRGQAEARARFGASVAEDLLSTFGRRLRNTLPKDAVVGRWSEQDFLAIVSAAKADGALAQRAADHLSMPYACMIGGKVVRISLVVTAEYLADTVGATVAQIQAKIAEAFQ